MGPVVDVEFNKGELPAIYNALKIEVAKEKNYGITINLVLEVELHVGDNVARCIAMD